MVLCTVLSRTKNRRRWAVYQPYTALYCLLMIKVPILIIGYNRPEIARITLNKIVKSSPSKVYFAIDGSKDEKDEKLVGMVKDIYHSGISGASCEYFENDFNQGPEITITSAISEVFKKEDRLIILEDDVVVSYSFLSFAEQMLDLYVNDDRIAMISGSNWAEKFSCQNQDYFFAYLGNTLSGWATWKRAWDSFSLKEDFIISRNELKTRFRDTRIQKFFYRNYRAFSLLPRGINTWDCCWQFKRIKNDKLSIVPRVNLTSNIGIFGTHFDGIALFHNATYDESFKASPIVEEVKANELWDEAIYTKFLSSTFLGQIKSQICLFIKVINILSHEYWKHL